jgi:hypothetical protein
MPDNVGGKPAVPVNDPYSSLFRASEIVLVIDLRTRATFILVLAFCKEISLNY